MQKNGIHENVSYNSFALSPRYAVLHNLEDMRVTCFHMLKIASMDNLLAFWRKLLAFSKLASLLDCISVVKQVLIIE